jgi:uncharacterized Tic20 family protein
MLAHLSGLAGLLVPFGNIIAPLVIWRLEREKSAFVAEQSLESLNFNISVMLAGLACGVLLFVGIGVLLGALLVVGWIAATILGALRAAEGHHFRHRLTLRLVH